VNKLLGMNPRRRKAKGKKSAVKRACRSRTGTRARRAAGKSRRCRTARTRARR